MTDDISNYWCISCPFPFRSPMRTVICIKWRSLSDLEVPLRVSVPQREMSSYDVDQLTRENILTMKILMFIRLLRISSWSRSYRRISEHEHETEVWDDSVSWIPVCRFPRFQKTRRAVRRSSNIWSRSWRSRFQIFEFRMIFVQILIWWSETEYYEMTFDGESLTDFSESFCPISVDVVRVVDDEVDRLN